VSCSPFRLPIARLAARPRRARCLKDSARARTRQGARTPRQPAKGPSAPADEESVRVRDGQLRRRRRVGSRDQARLFGVLGDPSTIRSRPRCRTPRSRPPACPTSILRYRVPRAARGRRARGQGAPHGRPEPHRPLKEAVLPLLDGLTPEAERIGAVNTSCSDPTAGLAGTTPTARVSCARSAGDVRVRAHAPS
jgi:hypothetical protein